jgi:hypothetical protein
MKTISPQFINRKHFIVCILLVLTIFQYSCKKDLEEEQGMPDAQPTTGYQVLQKIKSLGFADSSIVDMGNYYLVEGDITFSKDAHTHQHRPGGRIDQASTNSLISFSEQPNITVGIDASMPTSGTDNWRNEIATAINDWNNITDCRIRFTLTTAANPDIRILSDGGSLSNNTIAEAEFPSGGNAGFRIRVNLDFSNNANVGAAQKRYNMVHELGHCIGLRHTNWAVRGESTANQIPNTPATDGNSVMNGGTANLSWNGFSPFDITAVRVLYPEPIRFSAIWDTSSANQVWWPNCSEQQLRDKTAELWGQGFRISKMYAYVVEGQIRYNVIWNPINTPQVWWPNCSEQQLRDKTAELWGQGFRLAHMQAFVVNGQVRYNGIWNPVNKPQVWWPNCSEQQLRDKTAELWSQGFRLGQMRAFVVNGQVRYSATWDLINQPQVWWPNCTEQQLRDKTAELWGQGFRLGQMNIFLVNGQPRYSAIWNPINKPQVWWPNCSEDQMRERTGELWNSGMRFAEMDALYAH